jgi:hypothetical protein
MTSSLSDNGGDGLFGVCDDRTSTVIDCSQVDALNAASSSDVTANDELFLLSIRQSVHHLPSNSPCVGSRGPSAGVDQTAGGSTADLDRSKTENFRRRHRGAAGGPSGGCSNDVSWNVASVCTGRTDCIVELSDVVYNVGGDPSSGNVAGEIPCHGGRGEYLDIGYDCVSRG